MRCARENSSASFYQSFLTVTYELALRQSRTRHTAAVLHARTSLPVIIGFFVLGREVVRFRDCHCCPGGASSCNSTCKRYRVTIQPVEDKNFRTFPGAGAASFQIFGDGVSGGHSNRALCRSKLCRAERSSRDHPAEAASDVVGQLFSGCCWLSDSWRDPFASRLVQCATSGANCCPFCTAAMFLAWTPPTQLAFK